MPDSPASAPAAPAFVSARGLGMVFRGGIEALRDVTLDVARGDFVALVGPSGCGKSTLLRLVAGLIAPTGGELAVDGLAPRQARRERHDMAFVFQQPALLPWRTVADNVGLPLELDGQGRAARRERIDELLDLVGLREFARTHPHQLSGGMRMRVSLARALVGRPGLLLLDEPFGALDEITRQRLNEELRRLWASQGFTALFVTHNVFEAAFLAQRVVVMSPRPGRIACELAVPFESERTPALRARPEFAAFCGAVSRELQEAHR
ncbi:MAG: ABC transporter ATP-binding protein [Candidatus Sumerlaeia bacterium]|nr:ABC transporter ATP-binding protein [Candidatus Sumerlaeia bacterium]